MMKSKPPFFFILAALLGTVLLGACQMPSPTDTPITTSYYPVDTKFADLYRDRGGLVNLGIILSPAFEEDGKIVQYTMSGKMVYDPNNSIQSVYFESLGEMFVEREPPIPRPNDPNILYVEGQIVNSLFVGKFHELGGLAGVGAPLTSFWYNANDKQWEQYFENFAFVIKALDNSRQVRLLPYGQYACAASTTCTETMKTWGVTGIDIPIPGPTIPEPFATVLYQRIQTTGTQIVGPMITDGVITKEDGRKLIVFENLVLYTTPSAPNRVFALSIVESLGIAAEPMVPPSGHPTVRHFVIQNGSGYNVPLLFDSFIVQHGGYEIIGYPITEVRELSPGVYRQCFTNTCVEYHQNEPEGLKIRLSPIGRMYYDQHLSLASKIDQFNLHGWETPISANRYQINFLVFEYTRFVPDFTPVLTIKLPNNATTVENMELRDDLYQSEVELAYPIGELIPYEICITYQQNERCFVDSIVIGAIP